LINDLSELLHQESKIYEDILQISKNKTKIIVEGKVSELESVVKLEQTLVIKLGKLESQRESIVQKISEQMGLNKAELTLSELITHVKGEELQKLKICQGNLINNVNELKGSNELNSKLIKSSLDYIEFSINIMAGASAASNNYGSSGVVSEDKKRNFFDMKL
jgi:hypothetical protein